MSVLDLLAVSVNVGSNSTEQMPSARVLDPSYFSGRRKRYFFRQSPIRRIQRPQEHKST